MTRTTKRIIAAVLTLTMLGTAVVAAPSASGADPEAGLVPIDEWRARQADYLDYATSLPLSPSSPLSVMAYAERGFVPEVAGVGPDDFAGIFAKLLAFEDTGDFDINRLTTLLLRYRAMLDPALAQAIEDRILAFKYWWDEPTPEGVVDSQYYFTENHLIIFAANEYVAGRAFADRVFANDGKTGAEHAAHAEPRIRRWIELRSRFGFSEWLSNVYWMEDLKGVLLLAEFAEDPEIAHLASMVLDMMFVELASHLQEGSFGSTHGRSYMKDKLNARDDDTFRLAKMVFDDTYADYDGIDTALLLAIAEKYRPPEVARRIAVTDDVGTIRQHQSLPLDPRAPITAHPEAPYGLDFAGEDGIITWWSMGAQLPWQMAELSIATVNDYDLWDSSNFEQVAPLKPLVDALPTAALKRVARLLAPMMNPGLLSSVDTSTWRSPEVMLSAAQDWRPGRRSEQGHVWQATFDADALVFTNHPRNGVPDAIEPNAKEGYWTGEAAAARVAHNERTLIAVYAPVYPALDVLGDGAYGFGYEDYTHAFFPTEHFDEIIERDGWTIGRKGDGYIGVWSWRPTAWRAYDPATEHTRGLTGPFDLVAEGGADNVWITEVGRAADFSGAPDPFSEFVDAVTESRPSVAPFALGRKCSAPWARLCETLHLPMDGFAVSYSSPAQGETRFRWTPLAENKAPTPTVAGEKLDLHPPMRRWDSPWAQADWDSGRYSAAADGWTLLLDFATGERASGAP